MSNAATITLPESTPASRAEALRERFGRRCVLGFLVAGFLFQLGLFLFGDTPLRMPMRIGIYGVSMAAFVLIPGVARRNPVSALVQAILLTFILFAVAPSTSLVAAIAQMTLYFAVVAPMVWISRLTVSKRTLRNVVLLLWIFQTASATLGALQVKFPGTFDGSAAQYDERTMGAMSIVTADGSVILRPKGLSDTAGGSGTSGVSAIIFAMGVLFTSQRLMIHVAAVASMIIGLFAIILSHGRTNLILVAIAVIAATVVLIRRRDHQRLMRLAVIAAIAAIVGISLAFSTGGAMTIERWSSLTSDDPGELLYSSRGRFFEKVLNQDIWNYPLGAGAGRWGMMNVYFGRAVDELYVEIMWTALVFDGGLPLTLLYLALLAALLYHTWTIAMRSRDPEIAYWATVAFAFILSTIAAGFVYAVYIKPIAIEMFVLCACLFAVSRTNGATTIVKRTRPRWRLPVERNLPPTPPQSAPSHG